MSRLLCTALLTALAAVIFAQDNENVFSLKPSFGFNGCQIHGDNYSGYNKFGVFLGAAVNAKFNGKASLELGFYLSQKGSRKNQNPKNNDYSSYRAHLNYFDMPLNFRYIFNEKYFITFGPSAAYLISFSEEANPDNCFNCGFNRLEVAVNAGIGGTIAENITVELRTTNSVLPIRDFGQLANRVYYPNPIARMFNRGMYSNILSLFVTYEFRLEKNGSD